MEFDLANHRPGDLLNAKEYAELKRLRGEGNMDKTSETAPSSCSCLFDLGHWGAGGYHYWKPTQMDIEDNGGEALYAKASADLPWAYERCPRFREACKIEIDRRKSESRSGDRFEERKDER